MDHEETVRILWTGNYRFYLLWILDLIGRDPNWHMTSFFLV
jgi:hypothetical protein